MHGAISIIDWHGLRSQLFAAKSLEPRLEALVVGGEPEHAGGLEDRERAVDQLAVIALHVEVAAVGEGRRVEHAQRPAPRAGAGEEVIHLCADKLAGEAVETL